MRIFLLTIIFLAGKAFAQTASFNIHNIKLPTEVSYYDNQFSGLQVAHKKLYLLSESRIQDKREAMIYSVSLAELNKAIEDTTYQPSFDKITINGLNHAAEKMKQANQEYEGLEAFVIKGNTVYLSVETNTPSPFAYLLKGKLEGNTVNLSEEYIPVPKPVQPNGSHIYNAGFEAITAVQKKLVMFFEYNAFDSNYAYCFDMLSHNKDSILFQNLPFRITDITPISTNHFMALNLFYKGGGGDTIYRVPENDTLNNRLIKPTGDYEDYSRLIEVEYSKTGFAWKPVWEFPVEYRGYNWEGIARYKNGYFVINDKYTRNRPYASTLLYISPE